MWPILCHGFNTVLDANACPAYFLVCHECQFLFNKGCKRSARSAGAQSQGQAQGSVSRGGSVSTFIPAHGGIVLAMGDAVFEIPSGPGGCLVAPLRFVIAAGGLSLAISAATRSGSTRLRRRLRRFDHFPEFWILLQRFVLLHFQTGAEEKILECV